MQNTHYFFLFFLFAINYSCKMDNNTEKLLESYKNEIMETEMAFAEMAKKEGIPKAFLNYAAEDAVLNRNNSIIKGKPAIEQYFEKQTLQEVQLEWLPDFIDVSAAGDLGYTFGKYNFSAKDTSGQVIESTGIFHTVWKRQEDGKWRFVWD